MSVIEPAMKTCSDRLSHWVAGVRFEDLPADIVAKTRERYIQAYEQLTGKKF